MNGKFGSDLTWRGRIWIAVALTIASTACAAVLDVELRREASPWLDCPPDRVSTSSYQPAEGEMIRWRATGCGRETECVANRNGTGRTVCRSRTGGGGGCGARTRSTTVALTLALPVCTYLQFTEGRPPDFTGAPR